MPPAPASGVRRRVVVADDDVLLREGLVMLLGNAGYDVIERVGDARTLVEAVRAGHPDLVVVDIRMPPTNTFEGIDVARVIRSEFPQIGILLLSGHVEVETAIDFLRSGDGVGYLLKSRILRVEDLVVALERIALGGAVIDPVLVQELLGQQRRTDPLAVLSAREREVLSLVAEGRSNSGIAHRLFRSDRPRPRSGAAGPATEDRPARRALRTRAGGTLSRGRRPFEQRDRPSAVSIGTTPSSFRSCWASNGGPTRSPCSPHESGRYSLSWPKAVRTAGSPIGCLSARVPSKSKSAASWRSSSCPPPTRTTAGCSRC